MTHVGVERFILQSFVSDVWLNTELSDFYAEISSVWRRNNVSCKDWERISVDVCCGREEL